MLKSKEDLLSEINIIKEFSKRSPGVDYYLITPTEYVFVALEESQDVPNLNVMIDFFKSPKDKLGLGQVT